MKRFYVMLFLVMLVFSGCSTAVRYLTGKDDVVRIPQILAHIRPVLADNAISITGKIIIQNPNQSDLKFEEVNLTFLDEQNKLLASEILEWEDNLLPAKSEIESPIDLSLGLNVLNSNLIKVRVRTQVSHKELKISIPIDNVVAVLYLDAIRQDLTHPLDVRLHTNIYSKRLRSISIDYALEITNPFGVDLILEDGQILIFSEEAEPFSKASIDPKLLQAKERTQINGSIDLKEIIGKIIVAEFIRNHPLHIRFSADLRLPDTNIAIPLIIESVQEFDFSLFK